MLCSVQKSEVINAVKPDVIDDVKPGAWWLSGRALDYGARGRGSKPTSSRVVFLSSPKVLVIQWKGWLHLDMTEKLLTGTLNLDTNKLMR